MVDRPPNVWRSAHVATCVLRPDGRGHNDEELPDPRARAAPPRRVTVAAAADLQFALAEVDAAFTRAHPDITVSATYGSSGAFYAQIMNGAPYDVFLSADEAYPQRLVQAGLAEGPAAFRYSRGRLALWVPKGSALALGRLGMREFDLASDADLVFVLPDEEASELVFWTRVAERLMSMVSAYTGQGTIFAIDTRLRPDGREGALVQTESAYKSYFAERAEAWEGITYMKARAVAGDLERATAFLKELQRVDWRRYGQSARSRSRLAQMRRRIEKEQGAENPLKAGRGGYYDIDFALMYLRLKGAGIFYRALNTPARINVIEETGHLDRQDAAFLRDAATFYRAVDHGLRVITGQAAGTLPRGGPQLAMLTELVSRWTPEHLHDEPIEFELAHIRERTRDFFERLFGP